MAFLVSPGVQVKEVDLTNVVPAVATSIGAIAGAFEKGPVSEVTSISSEEELVKIFGKPKNTSNQFETFYSAANFLQYSDALRVVRAESGILNATAGSTGLLIRNTEHYLESFADGQASVGEWAARTAGIHGNSLGVSICSDATDYEQTAVTTTSAEESAGQTTISVTDASVFGVGDIVNFGESNNEEYEVTQVNDSGSSDTIVIKLKDDPNGAGLQNTISSGTNIRRRWRFYDLFDAAPGTSSFATQNGRGTSDELHIVVYDRQGLISGFDVDSNGNRTNGVLETFANLSKNNTAKSPQGDSIYYPDVIYRQSEFVYWMDHNTGGTNWGTDIDGTTGGDLLLDGTDSSSTDAGDKVLLDSTDGGSDAGDNIDLEDGTSGYAGLGAPTISNLSGGTDDYAVTAGELEIAYDRFEDTESLDVNLIIGGKGGGAGDSQSTQDTHVTMLTALVEKRKDCVAFVSPFRSATVGLSSSTTQTDNVINAFDQCPSSSYVVFDSGYKYMYDKYNDVFRFVPLNGDIAGLCANTDQVADSFFSPAGFNRGRIRGAIKLSYNPNGAERDRLYRARVNPVVNFAGQGVTLFGDKTALNKPSAFDRINVRRLFLLLEKAIATAAKFQLFEFNDEFTRAQFRNLVEPFLRDVQGRRGITDFSVVADATNNTGEVIDRNEFVADIFVKPSRSINFITLSFVATRTGVAFSEVGG
tara:strand:- start:544 stop:2646 length:2103 start_codon:yes stop_codon:yes gene_type:complete